MKTVGETGHVAYKYKLFGWYITISNSPVKFRTTTYGHNTANFSKLLRERRHIAHDKCERCGRDITVFGRMYHLLPAGDPHRNEVENVRFVCNSCYKAMVRNGAPLEIPEQPVEKGGEA